MRHSLFFLSLAFLASSAYVVIPPSFGLRVKSRRCSTPLAQLVRIPRNGDAEEDEGDGVILEVSQVETADGRALNSTGRSVASLQFMITRAMKLELLGLGYSSAEIERMDPPGAAAILAKKVKSSKHAQTKPKSKRVRFELQFTCNVCDAPNSHSISWHAYKKGTVLATCPACQSTHLIADHLNWIEKCALWRSRMCAYVHRGTPAPTVCSHDACASRWSSDFQTLEQYMAERGSPVERLVTDGTAASAAASSAALVMDDVDGEGAEGTTEVIDSRRPWRGSKSAIEPLDGISDEQV